MSLVARRQMSPLSRPTTAVWRHRTEALLDAAFVHRYGMSFERKLAHAHAQASSPPRRPGSKATADSHMSRERGPESPRPHSQASVRPHVTKATATFHRQSVASHRAERRAHSVSCTHKHALMHTHARTQTHIHTHRHRPAGRRISDAGRSPLRNKSP